MKIMQNVDYNGIRCESKEQMKNQTVFDDDVRAESNLVLFQQHTLFIGLPR